jgi:homoserine dehydrogenase
MEPDREVYDGDPVALIFGANLHRRHLSVDPRALIAARLADAQRPAWLAVIVLVPMILGLAASAAGTVLRHVATLEHGKIHIGVSAVPSSSPLASLRGTDNQIAIFTRRYNISPMIIQGPGAGKEVTSAGLLADIQKIAIRIVR